MCTRGSQNVCRTRRLLGIQASGGFAEFVAVPIRNCNPLPTSIPVATGALVEPLANAFHAFRLALAHAPDMARVGVIGSGMVGIAVLSVAKNRGVREVAITDLNTERLKIAQGAGADEWGDSLEGEFDVVFDAVGTEITRDAAVRAVRPDGTVVLLGLHEAPAGFDARDVIRDEKRVIGSFCYTNSDFSAATNLLGVVKDDWLERAPMSAGVEVFSRLLDSVPRTIKTLLEP